MNLFYSILLHVLIFFAIMLNTSHQSFDIKNQKIKIDIVQNHKIKEHKNQPSKNLFPKQNVFNLVNKNWKSDINESFNKNNKINHLKNFELSSDSPFGENQNAYWSFYKALFDRIDSNLVYDSLLLQFKHYGIVRLQFNVSPLGIIDLSSLKTEASDPILKVHSIWALKNALSTPLDKNKQLNLLNSITIQTQFSFHFADPIFNQDKQQDFGQPKLRFVRASLEKPVPDEIFEQLSTGGISPNISLMIERWQKYNKKADWTRSQFDPFLKYRDDKYYNL